MALQDFLAKDRCTQLTQLRPHSVTYEDVWEFNGYTLGLKAYGLFPLEPLVGERARLSTGESFVLSDFRLPEMLKKRQISAGFGIGFLIVTPNRLSIFTPHEKEIDRIMMRRFRYETNAIDDGASESDQTQFIPFVNGEDVLTVYESELFSFEQQKWSTYVASNRSPSDLEKYIRVIYPHKVMDIPALIKERELIDARVKKYAGKKEK
jgi:hypothetical protein